MENRALFHADSDPLLSDGLGRRQTAMQYSILAVAALSVIMQDRLPDAKQPDPAPSQQVRERSDEEPDDIIVEGYRDRTDIETDVQSPTTVSGRRSRTKYEFSERLAKCAARSRLSDLSRLRAVVDGEVNSAAHRNAQDRMVRIYITCSESPSLLSFTAPPQSALELGLGAFAEPADTAGVGSLQEASPLGGSIYDRGAFTIQALQLYAPDIRLTRKETNDPAVQERFNLREIPRNRYRLPADRRYFEVAVCMVRVEPRLSVSLAMQERPARLGDLQAALIDRANTCIGGAKNVAVDPTQFRIYIADAVYRWAVAARGVGTLIPRS